MRIGAHIAQYFRDQLHSELGLTSCAGISHNKVLAKLVGSTHKPNKQTLLQPHLAESLMLSLGECRKIPGKYPSISDILYLWHLNVCVLSLMQ